MKVRKGQSRIDLPAFSDILQVRAKEKGQGFPYLLVRMSLSEIDRMRKQDPAPYRKPTYYAIKGNGIELVSETRAPMEITVRYVAPWEEV